MPVGEDVDPQFRLNGLRSLNTRSVAVKPEPQPVSVSATAASATDMTTSTTKVPALTHELRPSTTAASVQDPGLLQPTQPALVAAAGARANNAQSTATPAMPRVIRIPDAVGLQPKDVYKQLNQVVQSMSALRYAVVTRGRPPAMRERPLR